MGAEFDPEGNQRGPDWIREFLVRWVMEMGSGSPCTTGGYEIENTWYGNETVPANHWDLREYFDFRDDMGGDNNPHDAVINQKGLDYIKGDPE